MVMIRFLEWHPADVTFMTYIYKLLLLKLCLMINSYDKISFEENRKLEFIFTFALFSHTHGTLRCDIRINFGRVGFFRDVISATE